MTKIFKNQELLTIRLDTFDTDIGSATELIIKYKKPSGKTGEWSAQREGSTTRIYYEVSKTDIDEAGIWKFQAWLKITDRMIPGDIAEYEIHEPL